MDGVGIGKGFPFFTLKMERIFTENANPTAKHIVSPIKHKSYTEEEIFKYFSSRTKDCPTVKQLVKYTDRDKQGRGKKITSKERLNSIGERVSRSGIPKQGTHEEYTEKLRQGNSSQECR